MIDSNILVADSGSTKTDWTMLSNGRVISKFKTAGVNPYVHSDVEMQDVFRQAAEQIVNIHDYEVNFYGAGCSSDTMKQKVKASMVKMELGKDQQVGHDLLAAGRALFKSDRGIACILGTGSNSALVGGGDIISNIPALGYVLGDEGGGVDLGRRLLIGIYKQDAPNKLIQSFQEEFSLDVNAMLKRVYLESRPNQFLASFAPFIQDHLNDAYIKKIVEQSFSSFVKLNILKYEDAPRLPVGFIGSIAYHFKVELELVLHRYNLRMGPVLKDPMQGLLKYHGLLA